MTKKTTTKLATSEGTVTQNILNYTNFLEGSKELQNRTAQHRAWYAIKHKGGWRFGNSKIIGYEDLKPQDYLAGGFDGRQTEAVLQKWFAEVEPNDPSSKVLYEELWEALADFLSGYGKSPSKLARINVPKAESPLSADKSTDAICDLIVEVAKGLDAERIKTVRKRLKTLL